MRDVLIEQMERLCKDNGLRVTGARRTILRVLVESPDHPNAEELHRRVNKIDPGISLATVYRTMNFLTEHGLIERHSFALGPARFEAAGAEHHDHFIDVETNEIIEFRCDEIEELQAKIAAQFGYEIVGHRFEIYVKRRPS